MLTGWLVGLWQTSLGSVPIRRWDRVLVDDPARVVRARRRRGRYGKKDPVGRSRRSDWHADAMFSRASFCAGVAVGGVLSLSIRWFLHAVEHGAELRPLGGAKQMHDERNLLCCCSCGQTLPASAFQSKQARRRDDQRKCRACVETYKSGPLPAQRAATLEANKALHRSHMAARAIREASAKQEPATAAIASCTTTDADTVDDPLRLARKAETVLRGRTDRLLLVLEDCSDDFNHVAVLRTCEALGVMRVWLIETVDRPTKNAYVQPSAAAADGAAAAAATVSVAPSRAQRQLETRAAQRGFEYDRMLGLRRAQLFAAHLDVRTFATTAECISAAREVGRELWVTDMAQDAISLSCNVASLAAQLPPYVAVVMGSEAAGVSDEMLNAADKRIFLPMYGFTESFNLSVAAALVMQRLLDAMPESRGQLPAEETDRLRRDWYSGLARSDAARAQFAQLADLGGTVPFCDARRPEALRDERRRVVKPTAT